MGGLLLIEGILISSGALISFLYKENDWFIFLISSAICLLVGGISFLIGRKTLPVIGRKEGFVTVTLVWIIFSLFGLLPFWLSRSIPSFTDAFFETMSGFTTTGASILNNIESLSHGMLFWRSFIQWIGGLGIIVFSLVLLPIFGFSGVQLFAAEVSGPTKDKIHPKTSETAKRILGIYLALTLAQTILLRIAGMTWFDAINHSFTTVATGGYSTKQASIAYWDSPFIQYIFIVFMVLAGVNFSLYYYAYKQKFAKVFNNEELKYYLIVIALSTIVIFFSIIDFTQINNLQNLEQSFREGIFHVVSIITTTGYATVDYMKWIPFTWIILLLLMLNGASAGSTTGGMKMVRVVILFKYCYYEIKKIIHPNAIIPVTYNNHGLQLTIVNRVLAFVFVYLLTIALGILILTANGVGLYESIGGVISSIGCVGPGLGAVGPAGNYACLPDFSKWTLAFLMLLGRLEIFTVLLIFTPAFWKK